MASTLPWLLMAVPAGAVVDAVDRRNAISWVNVGCGLLVFVLAAVLLSRPPFLVL